MTIDEHGEQEPGPPVDASVPNRATPDAQPMFEEPVEEPTFDEPLETGALEELPAHCHVIDADVVGGDGCAVTAAGQVYCWGKSALRPIRVAGLEGIVDVAVASGHACALRRDGKVLCWDSDQPGKALREVDNIDRATQIAAWGYVCALEASGAVKCWNASSGMQSSGPSIQDARKVAGSCALLADGEVKCWGSNASGSLGTTQSVGSCAGPYNSPCSVEGLPVATDRSSRDVSSGWEHACAVARDGTVACWGHNGYGQLGRPAAESPTCKSGFECEMLPRAVPNLAGVTDVYAGIGSTCVRTSEGRALCWGNMPDSQFAGRPAHEPREIPLPSRLRSVANERGSVCFVLEDGGLYCLGMHYVLTNGVGVLTFDPALREICSGTGG